ncbi:MAG: 50S ribosomal protein L3 [Euryarchaeota archaeon]|nr:50S ribosomal protein L3 [Euryarchaeota archaeon]
MGSAHHPRRGSMAYYPRKRAKSVVPRIRSWPEIEDGPRLQGFAGYKAGMTHVFTVDWRKKTTTAGQEIWTPVTVIEVPPMKVAAVRFYIRDEYGLKTCGEVWAENLDEELKRRLNMPKKGYGKVPEEYDEVRVIAYTQPKLVSGVPKKAPDIMEIRVGGGTVEQRKDYALGLLGKEIKFSDFKTPGKFVDVIGITKGKGFQGHIKRFGVKLLDHKNSKHRRMIGTLGPWHPDWVRYTVPQAGQMGFHQRTEYNKRIVKYVDFGEDNKLQMEITPKGGFPHYGEVRNPYVLIHGSVPGTAKRLVRFRDPVRQVLEDVDDIEVTYVSTESKQGV